MFLSRLQSLLGNVPAESRAYLDSRRRYRRRAAVDSAEGSYFATSNYETGLTLARRREVNRLFTRMRAELQDIRFSFHDPSIECSERMPTARQGLLIEVMVASEFVSDELDHLIAVLCRAGNEAEKRGLEKQLSSICNSVRTYSSLRERFQEFQRELDSILLLLIDSDKLCCVAEYLNFDPIIRGKCRGRIFVEQFLVAIEKLISTLTELASQALQKRDFETAAQLCCCNLQLSAFLDDVHGIISARS